MILRKGKPAVNVKIHRGIDSVPLPLDLGQCPERITLTDPAFTHRWCEAQGHATLDAAWQAACEQGWELLADDAASMWGTHAKVYAEGRSGGWAVVHGLSDPDEWDDTDRAKWTDFTRGAAAVVADIPRCALEWLYFNIYTPEAEHAHCVAQGMCE